MQATASRIKDLRGRRGYSQEELAERSGLSFRTIQRIENGETEPRGDSLTRLAAALDVTVDDLADRGLRKDNSYLVWMNLSAFSFVINPLLGILIPLIIWLAKRGKIRGLDDAAKNLINFQITWTVTYYAVCLIAVPSILPGLMKAGGDLTWNFGIIKKTIHHDLPSDSVPGIVDGLFDAWLGMLSPFLLVITLVLFMYGYNLLMIVVNAMRTGNGINARYVPAIPFIGK
jgi:transcriptional regulator with XRE-family HTH domain